MTGLNEPRAVVNTCVACADMEPTIGCLQYLYWNLQAGGNQFPIFLLQVHDGDPEGSNGLWEPASYDDMSNQLVKTI